MDKNTRSTAFTILDAKAACESYIQDLWKAIATRITYTDLSDSPCAFTEAPAEGVFSIYNIIVTGRECLNNSFSVLSMDHLKPLQNLQVCQKKLWTIFNPNMVKDILH